MILIFLLALGIVAVFAAAHNKIAVITAINDFVIGFLSNRLSDIKQLAWVIGIIALVLYGMVMAAIFFNSPSLTAIVLFTVFVMTLLVSGALQNFSATSKLGAGFFNSMGTTLVLIATFLVANQIWSVTHGGGFVSSAGDGLILTAAFIVLFLTGMLLKTPPAKLWKLCRRIVLGLLVTYFIGFGTLTAGPFRRVFRLGELNVENSLLHTDIKSEQRALVGKALTIQKGQLKAQDVVELFVDLRDYEAFTLPIRDEQGNVIGGLIHKEAVFVLLDGAHDFSQLVARYQSRGIIPVQKKTPDGVGIGGYISLRKGLTPQGDPTYFLMEKMPPDRASAQTLEVISTGNTFSWDNFSGRFTSDPGTIISGTKIRVLPGVQIDGVSGEEFIQIIPADSLGQFTGNPTWFPKGKVWDPSTVAKSTASGSGSHTTTGPTIDLMDSKGVVFTITADWKFHELMDDSGYRLVWPRSGADVLLRPQNPSVGPVNKYEFQFAAGANGEYSNGIHTVSSSLLKGDNTTYRSGSSVWIRARVR